MTFYFWSIFIAYMVNYFTVLFAKLGKSDNGKKYDNNAPRDFLSSLPEGPQRRAYFAHQNAFETLPLYAFGIIIAHMLEADAGQMNIIAAAFLILRIIYALAYIKDAAKTRSVVWAASFGCILGLFLLPL